ncbi:MAG: GNAT family N-acetyltransferase [Myxococcota bacterium]
MRQAVLRSIDDIPIDQLSELEGSRLDFSYGLLRAVEKSLWGELDVNYLALYDADTLAGLIPAYTGTNLNINVLLPKWFQDGFLSIVRLVGSSAKTKVVVAGSIISDKGWIPTNPKYSTSLVAAEMTDFLTAFSKQQKVKAVMLKDIHESFPPDGLEEMEKRGYNRLYSLPTVMVNTDFDNFSAYEQSLPKNSRKHARKVLKAAKRKLAIDIVEDYSAMIADIYPLLRATYRKANYKFDDATPWFLHEACSSVEPKSELIACRNGGRLVGALVNFFDGDAYMAKRIGIDYTDEMAPLIYTALMYRGIERAIERGCKQLYLGQSTYVPKMRLGGVIENEYFYVKVFDPVLRLTIPWQKRLSQAYEAKRVTEMALQGVSV